MTSFVHRIESVFPDSVVQRYRVLKKDCKERRRESNYDKVIRRIRKRNRPINVVFFALDSNTWKYDSVFQAMQKDPLFSPTVFYLI